MWPKFLVGADLKRTEFFSKELFKILLMRKTSSRPLFDADDADRDVDDINVDDDVGADVADGDDVEFNVGGCCSPKTMLI